MLALSSTLVSIEMTWLFKGLIMQFSMGARLFLVAGLLFTTSTNTVDMAVAQEAGRIALANSSEDSSQYSKLPWESEFEKMVVILNQPTRLDFFETPLEEVAREISQLHNVQVLIDRPSLEDVALDPSEPLSLEISDVRLGTALRLLLGQIELTLDVHDNVFIFTTAVRQRFVTRVYNVVELLDREHLAESAEALVKVITTSVQPQSWEKLGGGGTIAIYQGNLVVSQFFQNHIQIDALLQAIRHNIQPTGGSSLPEPSLPRQGDARH